MAVTEEQLLDVAVVVFDPGLDDLDADEQVFPEVRKAFQYKITRREGYRIGCYEGERGGEAASVGQGFPV